MFIGDQCYFQTIHLETLVQWNHIVALLLCIYQYIWQMYWAGISQDNTFLEISAIWDSISSDLDLRLHKLFLISIHKQLNACLPTILDCVGLSWISRVFLKSCVQKLCGIYVKAAAGASLNGICMATCPFSVATPNIHSKLCTPNFTRLITVPLCQA